MNIVGVQKAQKRIRTSIAKIQLLQVLKELQTVDIYASELLGSVGVAHGTTAWAWSLTESRVNICTRSFGEAAPALDGHPPECGAAHACRSHPPPRQHSHCSGCTGWWCTLLLVQCSGGPAAHSTSQACVRCEAHAAAHWSCPQCVSRPCTRSAAPERSKRPGNKPRAERSPGQWLVAAHAHIQSCCWH